MTVTPASTVRRFANSSSVSGLLSGLKGLPKVGTLQSFLLTVYLETRKSSRTSEGNTTLGTPCAQKKVHILASLQFMPLRLLIHPLPTTSEQKAMLFA